MKPVDMLGFGPTRIAEKNPAGGYTVTVTPHAITGLKANTVYLNDKQYVRYLAWLAHSLLIQEALPDLSDAEREILNSGIGDEDFQAATKEDEND